MFAPTLNSVVGSNTGYVFRTHLQVSEDMALALGSQLPRGFAGMVYAMKIPIHF